MAQGLKGDRDQGKETTSRARIKRDGDVCWAKAWILLRSTSKEPSPPTRGTGSISSIPSREEVEWGMDPRGVDQMKGLSNAGAATRLRIRECAFWPCSISHHPRITHIRNAPFNDRYCGNGCSQVTMLQGSHSGMGSVSNGNPAEASDPPKETC